MQNFSLFVLHSVWGDDFQKFSRLILDFFETFLIFEGNTTPKTLIYSQNITGFALLRAVLFHCLKIRKNVYARVVFFN